MISGVKDKKSPVVGVILGDPAGSSYELAVKAVLASQGEYTPVFIGNRERFEISRAVVAGNEKLEILQLAGRPEFVGAQTVYFCDLPAGSDIHFGQVTADSGKLTYDSMVKAIELERAGVVDGILMAPINKSSLHAAGYPYTSEFELFAECFKVPACKSVVTADGIFRASATGHCAFSEIVRRLSTEGVVATAEGLLGVMRHFMPTEECKIAVSALNPHAGENGLYGNEEATILQPAVDILIERGYNVIGPCPADTVFMRAVDGAVHGLVFLFHDQGNIAMKARYFGDATVIYTGIPSHLVSVGHGPAYGKAGKGTADPTNMLTAMGVLLQLIKSGEV